MNPIFLEHIEGEKPVLVQFHAEWCAPCKALAPTIDYVGDVMADRATILKVDIDRNKDIAEAFGIQSVPALLLFKKGEVLWHNVGSIDKIGLLKVLESTI